MLPDQLTNHQREIIEKPVDSSIFIEGPAQSGKTTACIARLARILENYPGHQILIISPQQSLAQPYRDILRQNRFRLGGMPKISTMSGIARDLVQIFWPVIKPVFNFKGVSSQPVFLSLETAQFSLSRIIKPLLEKGYFQSVKIDPQRLLSQIIDNLNKTAIHGLALNEIASRLNSGATDPSMLENSFKQVEECAFLFRSFCFENNLIDFSLLMEISHRYLFSERLPQEYVQARYKVLIADNIEEDTPIAHEFYRQCLKSFPSSTFVFDSGGGYRTFLGADAENAYGLHKKCEHKVIFKQPIRTNTQINAFRSGLLACINQESDKLTPKGFSENIKLTVYQFLPEMVDGIVNQIEDLIQRGILQNQIAVLTPYLSDVLKFSFTKKLKEKGIQAQTHRPSREYLSSSAIQAILTLAKIAHPEWEMPVSHYEFRDCLMRFIEDMDIIRAEQASKALLANQEQGQTIRPFDEIKNDTLRECITLKFGNDLQKLSQWIKEYSLKHKPPLDIFIQKIFGEILSQPQFTLHNDLDAATEIARIIQSIRMFRSFSSEVYNFDELSLGKTYVESINQGLLPSSFSGTQLNNEGILISPAHTFLMQNRSVKYQFWLDIGSLGWWERLYQPLTNPYVYQKNWTNKEKWNETKEYNINQLMMAKLINGLLLRCEEAIFVSILQTNEYGTQNNGPLLRAFQKMIRQSRKTAGA